MNEEQVDRCTTHKELPAAVGVIVQAADARTPVRRAHSATSVTTPTTSTVLQLSLAAVTSLRRSAPPMGRRLRERMFFLVTCFFRVLEHLDSEFNKAFR